MKIIDSHTHIGAGLKFYSQNKDSKKDPKDILDRMLNEAKENKVSDLVIIGGLELNLKTRDLLNLTSGYKNVHIVAGVDIDYDDDFLKQLEEWLENKKIVGIKFYPGYQYFYPNDKRCLPIYKICEKHNVPVIFHMGDTLAGVVPNPKIKYSHPLNIDEIAADMPNLKVIIAHMGNPWLIDCAEVMYKNPNTYADISGLVVGNDLKSEYGRLMKRRIEELVAYVGSGHKLLYGTDWPLGPMKPYIKYADKLKLTKRQKEDLFYKNAAKLFKIENIK